MNGKYVWIDCEMTGLNVWQDSVIEIAVIVTDEQLNIIAEGPNLIIHRPQEVMDAMNDWCKQHHGQVIFCSYFIVTAQITDVSSIEWTDRGSVKINHLNSRGTDHRS